MRALTTALATTALVATCGLVISPMHTAAAADGNPFDGPVGGERLGSGPAVVTAGGPTPPAVRAAAWLVADLDTGEVLAARAPHARMRPASTLKTLTALVLLPRLDPKTVVTGTDADARIEGSKVGVYPSLKYSVDLLFLGMFLNSGNDAVHALASADDGGVPATVRRMNAKAGELGAFDTTVTDPTGLDADGQLSSAYDLALIARAGLKRKDFSRYASTKIAYYPQSTTGTYQISNQNHLLWSYPGALGVKTGYTTLARNTFVGAASRDGHRLVVTLLNAPHGVSKDAAALLDWAFANRTALSGVGTLVTPADVARARDPHPAASPAPTAVPRTAPASGSKTGLTAGGPLRIAQTTLAKVPLWAYGIPPLLLVMSWFRPKPKARRARASAGTGGRPVARRRRH
jgi:D-alanyl-D-alanine carboxypeptidase (penicillin-binding protein 5/6)